MKLHVYITNPLDFSQNYPDIGLGNITIDSCPPFGMPKEWIHAGEVELDLQISREDIVKYALEGIDKKEEEIKRKTQEALQALKEERSSLLAIGYDHEA